MIGFKYMFCVYTTHLTCFYTTMKVFKVMLQSISIKQILFLLFPHYNFCNSLGLNFLFNFSIACYSVLHVVVLTEVFKFTEQHSRNMPMQ